MQNYQFDDEVDWDDEADEELYPDPDLPTLGSCCSCGESGPTVRNIMMLHLRAPTTGYGWGCFVCGLPSDGATAVLCDACVSLSEANDPRYALRFVCDGYPAENKRVPVGDLSTEVFAHDMSKHSQED